MPTLVPQLIGTDALDNLLVDFALTEAAYTVVRLLQEFPSIKLPDCETVKLIGVEKQELTLVLSISEGCKISIT
jgi:hypothetical protein